MSADKQSEKKRKPRGPSMAHSYDNILQRVEKSIGELEEKTWHTIKKEIDQAVEFESDVQNLTREEMELLSAYLKRDLKHLYHFMTETGHGIAEWFKVDLSLVEEKLRRTIAAIADKTRVDTLELEQRLDHEAGDYIAGEVACAGMLRCANCKYMMCLTETCEVEACHQCGGHYFHRVSSHWPREEETEG